jgi:hypothetical protein
MPSRSFFKSILAETGKSIKIENALVVSGRKAGTTENPLFFNPKFRALFATWRKVQL